MFERNQAKKTASDVLADLRPYLATLARDEKLRRRVVAAVAGRVMPTRRRSTTQALRGQVIEVVSELRQIDDRLRRKRRSRIGRNSLFVLVGAGALWVVLPKLRLWVARDGDEGSTDQNPTVVQYIDVDVPVRTAYNQWTQFEEFPRFMEGVDEVKQLDDTLLHWAVTVAGDKSEWDAKITQQEPDRSVAWESVDGRHVRGVVTFEPIGDQAAKTRIRLAMSYAVDGPAERVGAALGLDDRRVRGDLERFRDLIEHRQAESGAWRGEIEDGELTDSNTS